MSLLVVPPFDEEPWPTLGPGVCQLLEERCVFGPGSLAGQPAVIDPETRGLIYRAYEVFPRHHPRAGRRRFNRVGLSMRKGSSKTEKLAWIAFAELHPEAEVRFDGWDAGGNPVGRPVRSPYIPLLAYSQQQVEELAYGALLLMCRESPDAGLFDAGNERIVRLNSRGRADGEAKPLAGSPSARDGARTTFQGLDEPHRLTLPKHRDAHETMLANLPKRPIEDPWTLYVGTAGRPGQQSVAEQVHREAERIDRGELDGARLFYFHREASPRHDLTTRPGRVAAVIEASAEHVLTYSDPEDIAEQWERPGADLAYLERVWLNRWTQAASQAFDPVRFRELGSDYQIPAGAFVTWGFDGARFRDACGIVVTEIESGHQMVWARWERRDDDEDYEVDPLEVTAAVEGVFERFSVWRGYCDPPHFVEQVADWEARHPDQVLEWWTNRRRAMAEAVRAYQEAISGGVVSFDRGDKDLVRHVGNAGLRPTTLRDQDGETLSILGKLHPEAKFDLCMAAVLSWRARLDAIKSGAQPAGQDVFVPFRIR